MKLKLFKQFKNSITLGFGVLLISLSNMTQAQTYSNNEPIFRDSKGNMYISNGTNGVTPIYPVESNNSYYSPPNIVQTVPAYIYPVPAPAPVYREPVYTSGIVYDVAPWLLLGGAAIAISNSNRNRYYGHGYHYRPPVHHGRPPMYRPGNGHGHRGHR